MAPYCPCFCLWLLSVAGALSNIRRIALLGGLRCNGLHAPRRGPPPHKQKKGPYRSPHHPPPSGTAETNHGTAGAQSATRSPSPRANAADAQEPEPPPHQHAPGEHEGETAGGQGPRGRTTNTPPGRRERTSAAERRANAPRPEPNRPEETANTVARGNAERTTASTPEAHPTETGTPGGTDAHAPRAATQSGPPETREPENPTTGAPERNPARSPPTARLPHRNRRERPGQRRENVPRSGGTEQRQHERRIR